MSDNVLQALIFFGLIGVMIYRMYLESKDGDK